jgi:hypothetical protein
MNIEATWKNGNLCFKDFVVVKESETFYGVYERSLMSCAPGGELITSGETLDRAAKKAKLLQIGYDICRDNVRHSYYI